MKTEVRVRFAPSPTGPLHIGGIRTALFNYLYARKHGGTLVLRIEDTDRSRLVEGAESYIVESLAWCGIEFNEGPHIGGAYGPYRQSERADLYRNYAETLVDKGLAYYAFDSPDALNKKRADAEAKGETFVYNWKNRENLDNSLKLSDEVTQKKINGDAEFVIRFKMYDRENVSPVLEMEDRVRGQLSFDLRLLDDKILFKSDGMPTYHLANIVDDHLMKITHVIRGEEWLPSLPLHVLLYKAFGWTPPQFAHLPLIMKPVGKGKLSKRDGEKLGFPVYPLSWENLPGYRESGYLPEAVVNFLALLGWNPGTEQEIFSLDELISSFSLDRVNKAGARFDPEKTKWYNSQYIQQKSPAELAGIFRPLLLEELEKIDDDSTLTKGIDELSYIERTIYALKDRVTLLPDFWNLGYYFYRRPSSYNEKAVRKHWKATTADLLKTLYNLLDKQQRWDSPSLETSVKSWIQSQGISFGAVMPPLRLAIVGDLAGPHLFDIMAILGKEESLHRIKAATLELAPA